MNISIGRHRNVWILSAMLTVVMLGFGMVIPVFPFYVEHMGASGKELGLLTAISPFMQLFFAPLWGNVSDRRGRKPVLVIGVFGYAISMLLYGLATQLWLLFVARALGGILSAATLPTAYAYISDSTEEQDRAKAIGILGAGVGLGMILGPGVGGWLASDNLAIPFYITSSLAFVTLTLIVFLLPESLQALSHKPMNLHFDSSASAKKLKLIFTPPLGFLMFLAFLVAFGLSNFQSIFGLYALKKFGYNTHQVGLILTVAGLIGTVAQGILTGPLTKRWGESTLIRITLFASAFSFLLLLLARSFPMVLVTTGLFVLPNALLRPAVISLTSKSAGTQQGMAMGLNNSLNSLGRVFGPIWAGFVFDVNHDLPYISGAAIMLVGFLISAVWHKQEEKNYATNQAQILGSGDI